MRFVQSACPETQIDMPKGRSFSAVPLVRFGMMLVAGGGLASGGSAAFAGEGDDLKLSVSGSFRSRYEVQTTDIRANASGTEELVLTRLFVKTEVSKSGWFAGVEIQDSRAFADGGNAPIGTDDINVLEPLQIYGGYRGKSVFKEGDNFSVRVGRLAFDIGSRRLQARNTFRNTVNAFTGIETRWSSGKGVDLTGFFVSPVRRLPSDRASLDSNDRSFDREDFSAKVWGLHGSFQAPSSNWRYEGYLFGINEKDDADLNTANRDLNTLGGRVVKLKALNSFDLDVESALQWGTSRASRAASDTADLDHLAYFFHAEFGYTFDVGFKLRAALQYDEASGDNDPSDGNNDRFSTLFGVRREDFGHTGIFTSVTRENLRAAAIRFDVDPNKAWHFRFRYQPLWLYSERDTTPRPGVVDASGASGRFIGHQFEGRVRWRAGEIVAGVPLTLETGFVYLESGSFLRNAPNGPVDNNPLYGYLQTSISF